MIWTNEKLAKFEYDWKNHNKQEILKMYPNFTYVNLKSIAAKHKFKKPLIFINKYKLKNLLNESLESYYWIGFLIGDGNITNKILRITLTEQDKNHLQNFKQFLNLNINIRPNKPKYYNTYKSKLSYTISIADSYYCNILFNLLNISGPKTYNPVDLTWIQNNDKFLSMFIGLIDADGYIGNKKDSMIRIQLHGSWFNNLNYIKNRLIKLNFIETSIKTRIDKRQYAHLCIYTKYNFKILYDFIKYNNLPVLERKWSKLEYLYNV